MNADVIVIGLGAMGSAACYQLAKRGASVVGIDRYSPPHSLGSTHGETRVTRQAIGEGEHFVPFALRSYEIWRELESETGADLLTITGGLIISGASGEHRLHGNADFVETTIKAAVKFGIEHRVLDAGQITDEFPQFILSGNERAYFENEMGFLRPETCVETQLALAEKFGARLRLTERVMRVEDSDGGVSVVTDKGTYAADSAVVSAGPWVNELASVPVDLFKVYRQVLYWFDVFHAHANYLPGTFPTFIWEFGRWKDDYFYGFPAIDGPSGGLKIAAEDYLSTTQPEEADREVSAAETTAMFDRYISGHLDGVGRTFLRSAVCLYTVTPNSNFVVDRLSENVILASPCSGHGFKHSAAIGETLAELALAGKSTIDVSPFALRKVQ